MQYQESRKGFWCWGSVQMPSPHTVGGASDVDSLGVQTGLQRAVQDPEASWDRVGVQWALQGATERPHLWNHKGKGLLLNDTCQCFNLGFWKIKHGEIRQGLVVV